MRKLILFFLIILATLQFSWAQENTGAPVKAKALYGGYIGLGVGILTDKLSDHFNTLLMLPLTGDFIYKNFFAQFNLDGGWAKVSKTMMFPDSSRWNKGDNSWHSTLGINLGFSVYNSKKIRITPLVGYANITITKSFWSMNDNEPSINCINVGFVLDFKNTFITKENAASVTSHSDYTGVRVTAGAYLPYEDSKPYPDYYNGATIYVSVGIVDFNIIK